MTTIVNLLHLYGITLDSACKAGVNFLLVFIFTMIGAYLNEVYMKYKNPMDEIEMGKVMLVCITSTFILFALSDKLLALMDIKLFILICYASGAGGHKYLDRVYNGELMDKVLAKFGITLSAKDSRKRKKNKDDGKNE